MPKVFLLPFSAEAAVINVDINAPIGDAPPPATHVGDDGALSTPGGTLWNGVDYAPGGNDRPG